MFRVFLQRRWTLHSCRCGLPLDSRGHSKVWQPATNVTVGDLDLVQFAGDARRLEVVADGLPLFAGAQLAVDTTLVSALHAAGEPRRGGADEDGVSLVAASRRKERTYPELVGLGTPARLPETSRKGASST